jgi:HPt (histidine-containing phosphotransfer) domain-containing protein
MSDPTLDHSRLARLERLGGRTLVIEMIDTFTAAAPARRTALQKALAGNDLTALADAAHAIVAGAGQLGAMALMDEARRVEESARTGDGAAALGATPTLLSSFDTALAALDQAKETR